jgi:anti-sigma B factor antagonist
VQVGVDGPTVWVRVQGRGSFQNSTGLKEFAAEMAGRGHREFIVDLKDCELMDSTFMGTLAGIALKLGREGNLRVIRANNRCRSVLQNLGLDRVFTVEEAVPDAPAEPLHDAEGHPPREAKRETIIEAHENLVAANPDNAVRFKDVIEFLQHKEPGDQARP